jgi:hypothetical protein
MFNITTVVFDGLSPPSILQTLKDGTSQVQILAYVFHVRGSFRGHPFPKCKIFPFFLYPRSLTVPFFLLALQPIVGLYFAAL